MQMIYFCYLQVDQGCKQWFQFVRLFLFQKKFSTNEDPNKSKIKCIIFSKTKIIKENIASIMLNKNPLPWVDEVKHLGNILQSNNSMSKDCTIKRGQFIGKVNALMQELHFVGPSTMQSWKKS